MAGRDLSVTLFERVRLWCVMVLFGATASSAEIEATQPVGYLRADIVCPTALTFTGTTLLTNHLLNISDAPVLMAFGELNYAPDFVYIGIPGKETLGGVWGPEVETNLWPKYDRIVISGAGPPGDYRFRWPKRDGIIILRDEGYARFITLLPGWLDTTQTPAPVFNNRMRFLVVDDSPNMLVSLPVLQPDAVQPGKPIIFGTPKMVYAPGRRLVPFIYSDPKLVPAAQPVTPPATPTPEHALELRVEVPATVEADRDVTAIYLVGNTGSKPVWVVQNRMVPPLATWEVTRDGTVIATIDGTALRPLLELLPARAPLLLNPGEYLTYRRVLLASALPLRRGNHVAIRARLDVPWYPAEPQPQEEPKVQALDGFLEVTVK